MRILTIALLLNFLTFQMGYAQEEPIQLNNPSFEDFPQHSKPPIGWYNCGFPNESPPDIQPSGNPSSRFFEVAKAAQDGNTYLGMVVRDNDTWEMVSQRLSGPLKPGKCYEFSLYISRSELYVSPSRTTDQESNYTIPAKLRIWGGSATCNKKELLGQTVVIKNTRWLKYDFRFEPEFQHTYIVLEAFYNTPVLFPYNGNVLVDHASAIVPVPCEDENPPLAVVEEEPVIEEPPLAEVPERVNEKPSDSGSSTVEEIPEKPAEPKIMKELDREKLTAGQTIRIDKLYFEADSAKIKSESFKVLEEIFKFLETNKDVVVEIGGHTNGNPPHAYCDRLSTARAKAVADFLAIKGISYSRLQFRGYGKREPVSSNATAQGRRANQRVEIKILSFDG